MSGRGCAGLKVGFNTEGTEFTERGKRRVDDAGDEHRKWQHVSYLLSIVL